MYLNFIFVFEPLRFRHTSHALSEFASQIKFIRGWGQLLVTGSQYQGPKSQSPRSQSLGSYGPRSQGPGSQVLILDHALFTNLVQIGEKTRVPVTVCFPDYAFNEIIHNMYCFHEWNVFLIHLFYD